MLCSFLRPEIHFSQQHFDLFYRMCILLDIIYTDTLLFVLTVLTDIMHESSLRILGIKRQMLLAMKYVARVSVLLLCQLVRIEDEEGANY